MKASNLALFAVSLLLGTAAIFWPNLERAWQPGNKGKSTKCPLGYEGPMPQNHPPIGAVHMQPSAATTTPSAQAEAQPKPPGAAFAAGLTPNEYLFVNGNIWTANPKAPWAGSMAVDSESGLITAIGGLPGSAAAAAATAAAAADGSSSSKVVDLQGAFVTPGMVDPHVHLMLGGLHLLEVDLRGLSSVNELQVRLAAAAQGLLPGAWLLGAGWSEADWGGTMPHAAWIDEACGDHPAFLIRMDHHMALANTRALEMAGLMEQQRGGSSSSNSSFEVDIDAAGEPSGLLREGGMDLIRALIPPPSLQQRHAALAAAGAYLLARGVTTVGDMGWGVFNGGAATWADLEGLYLPAAEEGRLPVRVSAYVPLRTWRRLAHLLAASGDHHSPSQRLFWGGVKEFLDGSLGSSTALFWEPYQDAAGDAAAHTGMRTIPQDELKQLATAAAKAGLQVAVHAMGDRAVDEVLEVFESVQARVCGDAPCAVRHRVEHVQHISSPVSAAKLSMLDLIAVPNPQHLLSDRHMLLPKLGPLRAGPSKSFAYKTFSNAGASVGFGSDWPVVEVDPFESVFAAVYRAAPAAVAARRQQAAAGAAAGGVTAAAGGGGGRWGPILAEDPWAPQEQLPLDEVLLGHTAGAAAALRLDHLVGALLPGLKGDFVVWDRSPFEGVGRNGSERGFGTGVPEVVATYVDGACVCGCSGSSRGATSAAGGEGEGAGGLEAEADGCGGAGSGEGSGSSHAAPVAAEVDDGAAGWCAAETVDAEAGCAGVSAEDVVRGCEEQQAGGCGEQGEAAGAGCAADEGAAAADCGEPEPCPAAEACAGDELGDAAAAAAAAAAGVW